MGDVQGGEPSIADAVFTVTTNPMWQLYYESPGHGVSDLEADLLTAIGELDAGPWQYLGATTDIAGVPLGLSKSPQECSKGSW